MKDYYTILGVSPLASGQDIQRAFRRLALEYHPDVNRNSEAEAKFQEINAAYQVLKDAARRAEYDASRTPSLHRGVQPAAQRQGDARRYYFQRRVRAATDPGSTWNYYDVLGVPRNANEDTIVRAYQRLYADFYALRDDDPGTAAILQEIVEARDLLVDPSRRQAYDALPLDRQAPGYSMGRTSAEEGRKARQRSSPSMPGRRSGRIAVAVGILLLALATGSLLVLTL